jgi:hypothetical protein
MRIVIRIYEGKTKISIKVAYRAIADWLKWLDRSRRETSENTDALGALDRQIAL